MVWKSGWLKWFQRFSLLLVLVVGVGLAGCGDRPKVRQATPTVGKEATLGYKLMEVAPPPALQSLRPALEGYLPQVSILQPRPNEVLEDNTVTVRLQATDFPAFKNADLGLGPHLHFFLDDQPYQAIYDPSKPVVLENLTPGTHTIRVFASRPWHESFKNDGAYAQTTFHIFTKTPKNNPDAGQPLLTYSRPQGSYGAEPVMLDFYLTNVPLHLIAQESTDDEILDWRIRCTVNGETFLIDDWQPIYLKGLKPGKNWVQLELIDEKGNSFANAFNHEARIITYEPGGQDALARLVRGDLSAAEARGIVDPNYVPEPPQPEAAEPEPVETVEEPATEELAPELAPDPIAPPTLEPDLEPDLAEPAPLPESPTPLEVEPIEAVEPPAAPEVQPGSQQDEPEIQVEEPAAENEPIDIPAELLSNEASQAQPIEELPAEEFPEMLPQVPTTPEPGEPQPRSNEFRRSPEIQRDSQETPVQRVTGFFDRFRQNQTPANQTPAIAPPVAPEPLVTPTPLPEIVPELDAPELDAPEPVEIEPVGIEQSDIPAAIDSLVEGLESPGDRDREGDR